MSLRVSYVQLLGRPRAQLEVAWHEFQPDKRYWLLSLLAYGGDRLGREQLSALFWPDATTAEAKHNLRQLLQRVKRLGFADALEVSRHGLRWQVETDVAAFWRALAADASDEALALYGGPLLAGMETYRDAELTSWLGLEREQLHGAYRAALLRHAAALGAALEHGAAAQHLQRLLHHDDLDEEALCAYMGASAQAGRLEDAITAFQRFERKLEAELGLSPAPATVSLAQAIGAGERPHTALAAPTRAALPLARTSFVGRDLELLDVLKLLEQPGCRLLTLTGHGGVGKTRLAQQAARQFAQVFPDGLAYVPLETLANPADIAPAVARVLALELRGQAEPLELLAVHLGEGRKLLVLDNFEQLLAGAEALSELLARCPNLKVLVTSRAPLGLHEEWLFPVRGLPFPEADAGEQPLDYEAVRLFAERAAQANPDFALSPETQPHVAEICRVLDGSPLGLELAAAWVRLMPAEEIARDLRVSLDLLGGETRNVPERHKSLRATFEHSWRLLSAPEQDALAKLSVFRGGFTREAALQVAGAGSLLLAALADKALVRPDLRGRFERHPLLYQFTQEKFAQDALAPATRDRHAEYFLGLLQQRAPAAHANLADDFENVRAAWGHTVLAGRADALARAADALTAAFSDRPFELVPLLHSALALVRTLPEAAARAALELPLTLALGPPLMVVKGYAAPELKATFERAHALVRALPESPQLFPALWGLWGYTIVRGDCRGALPLAEQCLRAAQASGDPALLAEAHRDLEENLLWLGDLEGAHAHLRAALEFRDAPLELPYFLQGHDPRVTMRASGSHTLWLLGHTKEALELIREAVAFAKDHAHPNDLALALVFAVWFAAMRRDADAALALGDEMMSLSGRHRNAQLEGVGRVGRGWALSEGAPEAGLAELRRGVALWRGTGAALIAPFMNALLAEACARAGRDAEARVAVHAGLTQSAAWGEAWWDAELHRVHGTLLPDPTEAEAAFARALATARQQGARALELRAATDLSRLLGRQGRSAEAHSLLTAHLGVREDADSPDSREAVALLAELRQAS